MNCPSPTEQRSSVAEGDRRLRRGPRVDSLSALASRCPHCGVQGDFPTGPGICHGSARHEPLWLPRDHVTAPAQLVLWNAPWELPADGDRGGLRWSWRLFCVVSGPAASPRLSVSLSALPETQQTSSCRDARRTSGGAAAACRVWNAVKGFRSHGDKKLLRNFARRSLPWPEIYLRIVGSTRIRSALNRSE